MMMVVLPPPAFVALTPAWSAPVPDAVADPDSVTRRSPDPESLATTPCTPVTLAAAIVTPPVPVLLARIAALRPMALRASTWPVAVTERNPVPDPKAAIPWVAPVAEPTRMVRLPSPPSVACTAVESAPLAVTLPDTLTARSPSPLLTARMPCLPPATSATRIETPPLPAASVFSTRTAASFAPVPVAVTAPVATMPHVPLPTPKAAMPCRSPVTLAALSVIRPRSPLFR